MGGERLNSDKWPALPIISRGFFTSPFSARWRHLIRSDARFQAYVLNASSLDELKALCELPDYRLYFTRTKWTQIMECVADYLFHERRHAQHQQPHHHQQKQQEAAAAARESGGAAAHERTTSGRLNLSLNLFRNLSSASAKSGGAATAKEISGIDAPGVNGSLARLQKVFHTTSRPQGISIVVFA